MIPTRKACDVMKTMLATALLAGVMACPALGQAVSIEQKQTPVPERGEGLVQYDTTIHFKDGSVRYRGIAPAKGKVDEPRKVVTGKWGDYFFGLIHFRQSKNGGWNGWDFLQASVILPDGSTLSPQREYLADVFLLERESRMHAMFVWPLVDKAGQSHGRLVVTLLQYPTQPQWIFTRVAVEESDAKVQAVAIHAYPGSAASTPPERERWMAVADAQGKMARQWTPLSADKLGAAAFFNRYADMESGCFLVYDPAGMKEVAVRELGTVDMQFKPADDASSVTFALGGYRKAQSEGDVEQAVRQFLTEHASQALHFMQAIDWTPAMSMERSDAFVAELAAAVSQSGDDAQKARFASLKQAYDKAKADTDAMSLSQTLDALRQLHGALVKDRLDQFR